MQSDWPSLEANTVEQIFHITQRSAWLDAQRDGHYRGDTLDTEGFIHCSTREQVVWVANQRFRDVDGLVLLVIDINQVKPAIRYESVEEGELFPHIYGPLNSDAVTDVVAFVQGSDGVFTLPADVRGADAGS